MRRWGFRRRAAGPGRFAGTARVPASGKNYFSMADAVPGKQYRVIRIDGGYRLNSRMCAMGFVPGEVFYVSGASRGGPRCVVIKGTKFAIGRGMAERIQVEEAQ
jgi:Fe2+ transport system protein FeoA